ncbi:hypothetical protein NLX83_27230 [Allokutzneria sp. A3M-2-11 16]|uniref:hypothetical protein n=1 Tax=Allokutzneria sp. A3M-2-11 16 TaxID=2962043 RepID=UPI0020B74590|nr:hypothetical protein [Allokutzneria sp. A3M-2-11 16]MCP3802972.1 hypothetical protein [Allokutzneria sp. A3M-2-11 16]
MKIKALALAATMLLLAGTAHAGVRQYQDGFENSPATKWRTVGHAGYDINTGNARTGQNNAWLHVGGGAGARAHLYTEVQTGVDGPSTCTVQIYAHPLNDRSKEVDEIAIYDNTNTVSRRVQPSLRPGSGYEPITIGGIQITGPRTLKIFVILQDDGRGHDGEWVRLDDFSVSCQY